MKGSIALVIAALVSPIAAEAAPSPPPGFRKVVDARKAALAMHVVDWWQDDLDRDGKAENIAELCSGDAGVYLIEHQGRILIAARKTAGREGCPADTGAPAWRIEHRGFIDHSYSVHRASENAHIAVRDHHAVVIYDGEDGADGQLERDWDALTISDSITHHPPLEKVPFVVIADAGARWTTVAKGVAVSATVARDQVVVHVKSATPVQLSLCPTSDEGSACTKQIAKPVNGIVDVPAPETAMIELDSANGKSRALLIRPDGPVVSGYPSAAPSSN